MLTTSPGFLQASLNGPLTHLTSRHHITYFIWLLKSNSNNSTSRQYSCLNSSFAFSCIWQNTMSRFQKVSHLLVTSQFSSLLSNLRDWNLTNQASSVFLSSMLITWEKFCQKLDAWAKAAHWDRGEKTSHFKNQQNHKQDSLYLSLIHRKKSLTS